MIDVGAVTAWHRAARLADRPLRTSEIPVLLAHPLTARALGDLMSRSDGIRRVVRLWMERMVFGLRWRDRTGDRDAQLAVAGARVAATEEEIDGAADGRLAVGVLPRPEDGRLSEAQAVFLGQWRGATVEDLRRAARALSVHHPVLLVVAHRLRVAGHWDTACDRLPARYRHWLDLATGRCPWPEESEDPGASQAGAVRAVVRALAGDRTIGIESIAPALGHPEGAVRRLAIAAVAVVMEAGGDHAVAG